MKGIIGSNSYFSHKAPTEGSVGDLIIRRAAVEDYDSIGHVLRGAYERVLHRMAPDDAEVFSAGLTGAVPRYAGKGTWLVAEVSSELAGVVAFFGPASTQHPLFQGNVAHIQLLGVGPDHERRGVAKALMNECMRAAANSKATELLLQTSVLMPEARSLYERLGFQLTKELPPVWGEPAYLYAKRVD